MAKVGGVEHWPRSIVHQFHNSRPGKVLNRQDRTTTPTAPTVHHPVDGIVTPDIPPVPALVRGERYGWRTATSRRHPLTKGVALPPDGDGIR